MTRTPGRDQTAPMERLVRLIAVLGTAEHGASVDQLLRVVVPGEGDLDTRKKMLQRDLDNLNLLGYDVRNTATPGAEAVYRMRARDNRLQVTLTAEQRGELLRAALAAGLQGMDRHLGDADSAAPQDQPASPTLDLVQRATTRHCLVRFSYKGTRRVVVPAQVHSGPSGWYLSGREDGQDVVKEFVVSRMSEVSVDAPATADAVTQPARPSLDPLSWKLDPPAEVVVEVPVEHQVLVENLLGAPKERSRAGDLLTATYDVTHRRVFRDRIYELGTRVRVRSPADVRAEVVAELRTFVADGS